MLLQLYYKLRCELLQITTSLLQLRKKTLSLQITAALLQITTMSYCKLW